MDIRQTIIQKQELHLTPQVIQSIKLLQYSSVELFDEINKELLENPLLEISSENIEDKEHSDNDEKSQEKEEVIEDKKEKDDLLEVKGESEVIEDHFEDYQESDFDYTEYDNEHITTAVKESEEFNDFSWEEYFKNQGSSPSEYKSRNEDYDDLYSADNKGAPSKTLQEHLLSQSEINFDFDIDKYIARLLIGQINNDGILDYKNEDIFSDIVENVNRYYGEETIDSTDVEEVLSLIQFFDPVGCGARNKIETLLIQAKYYKYPEYVIDIIKYHLEDLANRRISFLTEKYSLTNEKIMKALALIRDLEPIPAREFSSEETEYVIPDIFLVKEENEYKIKINNEYVPELRISNKYKEDFLSKKTDKGSKEFIKQRLDSAKWLIDAIKQRQSTIKKVAEAILYFQYDFFEKGVAYIRPITLKDVADYINMNESTVSRVTSNKYLSCDLGVYSLKYFFSSAVNVSGGDSLSSTSVKNIIEKIIKEEDCRKPLSDDNIMKILKEEYNLNLTRRTVANYRTSLGILSSSKRKQFV